MEQSVVTAACASYETEEIKKTVRDIFDRFGGAGAFLRGGNRVLIKPNLLMARTPGEGTTTHPELVAATAELFVEAGAVVTIADSPGGPYNDFYVSRVYRACGMEEAARRSGARLSHDFTHRRVNYDGFAPRAFDIITPVAEADVVISLAKMKTHMMTYFTGAVKNLYGVVPGLTKAKYHSELPDKEDFCRMIIDLCRVVTPSFCIIDGVEGMDGKGPSGGRVRKAGVLIASKNPFAADLAAMHIAGLLPERAPIHNHAWQIGLVPRTAAELTYLGDVVPPLADPFIPAVAGGTSNLSFLNYLPRPIRAPLQRALIPAPKMTERCVGCGDCARACPVHAIVVKGGKASIDRRACIRCYCCHELCPIKAVEL